MRILPTQVEARSQKTRQKTSPTLAWQTRHLLDKGGEKNKASERNARETEGPRADHIQLLERRARPRQFEGKIQGG